MKDKQDVAAMLYVVLGALVDAKPTFLQGVPNGHLYVTTQIEIHQWIKFVSLLKDRKWVTESNYLLKITPAGEEIFNKLDDAYKKVV